MRIVKKYWLPLLALVLATVEQQRQASGAEVQHDEDP